MQRSEIHTQITEVAEKIATLNRHLSQSSKIMKAETDLMNVYIDELKLLLSELANTIATAKPEPQQTKQATVREEIKPEPAAAVKKEEKKPAEPAAPQKTEPAKPASEKITDAVASKSLNERFSKKTIDLAEKLQQNASGKHLKDLISLSDKFMFVNELFQNDKKHFDEAVKKINELQSFDEAVQVIEEELKTHFNWDKKQKTVEQFQQSVKKKFGNKN
jgi:hypothetical protein